MDGCILYTTSALAPVRFGIFFPPMVKAGFQAQTQISVTTANGSVTQSTINLGVGWLDENGTGSIILSIAGGTSTRAVFFKGKFLVSNAAGTIGLMAAGSTTASNSCNVLKGSYVRVFKIGDGL